MEENESRPVENQPGQATAPGSGDTGQSAQTTGQPTQPEQAPRTQAEAEEFISAEFDSLPADKQEALRPYYDKIRKELQGGFTKKAQTLAKMRQDLSQKEQAYDQFMRNPVENLQRMAQQYGYTMTPAQAQQALQQQQQGVGPDWSPNAWDDVFKQSGEYLMPQVDKLVQQRLSAYEEKIAKLEQREAERNASRVKKQLDQIDPNWSMYEDEMRQVLEVHPSLANDIPKLYQLAVPREVLESKATQAALKRYEQKAQAAKVESSGATKQSGPAKPGIVSFEEAFQAAKRDIGRK